jgi:hypothetical protein
MKRYAVPPSPNWSNAMTQYLLSVHDPTGGRPELSQAEMQRMFSQVDAFNEEIRASGSWVFAGGLTEPSSARVVDATGDKALVTDGPYAETKEQLGGFWVVEAPDLDAALEIAERGSAACEAPVEVRPFQGE